MYTADGEDFHGSYPQKLSSCQEADRKQYNCDRLLNEPLQKKTFSFFRQFPTIAFRNRICSSIPARALVFLSGGVRRKDLRVRSLSNAMLVLHRRLNWLLLCGVLLASWSSFAQQTSRSSIKVFLAGDSTMSNKEVNAYPETGWGCRSRISLTKVWRSTIGPRTVAVRRRL